MFAFIDYSLIAIWSVALTISLLSFIAIIVFSVSASK